MTMIEHVLVFGAGGHAKVVIDAIEKQKASVKIWVFDDNPATWGTELFGYPVIGNLEKLLQNKPEYPIDYSVIAIGDNKIRLKVASIIKELGIPLRPVVHPSAEVSRGVEIGDGTVLFANSVVNADTWVGGNVIINTGATVDHDCMVGDGVHLAPGVNVCGGVTIGEGTFVGAGSTIIPGIQIGCDVIIGAGSTVLGDVESNSKVAGTPAKNI